MISIRRIIYVIVLIYLYANTIKIECGCCCCLGKTDIEYIEDKKMECLIKDEENTEEMYKKNETEITNALNSLFESLTNEHENRDELINTIAEVLSEHKVVMTNIGATCYMNAIIQMISHHKSTIEKIIKRAFEIYDKGTIKENTVTVSLAMLLINIWEVETRKTKNINIATIHMFLYFYLFSGTKCKKGAKNAIYERFRIPNQNDASDFFEELKDKINTEEGDKNNVLKHFELSTNDEIKCKNCEYTNTKEEPNYVLHVPINKKDNNKSLQDIINNELSREEEIEYKCSNCTRKGALKKEIISSTNDNIIISIKRYNFDEKTKKTEKIKNLINVDDILTINGKKYQLKAIINHLGGVGGGHYNINIKLKDSYYTFEDSVVYESRIDNKSKTAYIILYEIMK